MILWSLTFWFLSPSLSPTSGGSPCALSLLLYEVCCQPSPSIRWKSFVSSHCRLMSTNHMAFSYRKLKVTHNHLTAPSRVSPHGCCHDIHLQLHAIFYQILLYSCKETITSNHIILLHRRRRFRLFQKQTIYSSGQVLRASNLQFVNTSRLLLGGYFAFHSYCFSDNNYLKKKVLVRAIQFLCQNREALYLRLIKCNVSFQRSQLVSHAVILFAQKHFPLGWKMAR